jgi:GNAT superfamily N-acetyltransferase
MTDPGRYLAAMEATWPAAATLDCGPFLLREGRGGGKRVSAATAQGIWDTNAITAAEQAMREIKQVPLFLIRGEGDALLDAALSQQGYPVVDPVVLYASPLAEFAPLENPLAAFDHWPPLAIATEIWAQAGVGPARLAVMERATGPKCVILGRSGDRVSGVAFVACHGDIAMLHALEVLPNLRRRGAARAILQQAAAWAARHAATTLALAVTTANAPARSLYESLGMMVVGDYHYRQQAE